MHHPHAYNIKIPTNTSHQTIINIAEHILPSFFCQENIVTLAILPKILISKLEIRLYLTITTCKINY